MLECEIRQIVYLISIELNINTETLIMGASNESYSNDQQLLPALNTMTNRSN
jgi:hypothetical protein